MAYYTKVLQPDENVKYIGALHWIIYKHAIFFGILAIVAAAVWSGISAEWRPAALIALAILLVLTVLSFLGSWFGVVTTEIVVTDKRIIHKTGWIARHTQEMNITKVETVDVNQGIGGRIFGYGTVWIRGIGGSWEPLRYVATPLALRNAIIVG